MPRAPTREAHAACVGFCVGPRVLDNRGMLLAYIDEIGEPGAFISRDHARYSTSPAFGYAGFVIDAERARSFGQRFTHEKRKLFRTEIERSETPGQWERKGASMFRTSTDKTHPQHLRVFAGLVGHVRKLGGRLFYYADEKPLGTPKQTDLDPVLRETLAMQETLNRLCTYADRSNHGLLVMIDQINEKTRAKRLPNMYGHIFRRSADRPEMKRIVEPPMHVDSVLSANIQFADWIAAAVTRAIDNQLIKNSPYQWVPKAWAAKISGAFTHESKLHLWHSSLDDIHNSEVFRYERRLHPVAHGHRLGDGDAAEKLRRVHAAASVQVERDKRRS